MEVYKLSDSHRPVLTPGPYELKVTWKVEVDRQAVQPDTTESVWFHIAGERFWLNPSEIEAVYPPEGTSGDYSDHLPHVVLSRDTLPWERSAKPGSGAPWLALLLLNADEAAQCPLKSVTLKEYRERLAAYSPAITVDLDPGQENESVNVIELPHDVPAGVLPTLSELSLLCHTRVAEKAGKDVNSAAVVVGKRLPSPGRNTVHLVMLENRFIGPEFPLQGAGKCLLISLKSWSFTSQVASAASQDISFEGLQVGWLQLPPTNGEASNYLKAGFVPLPHSFRSGESGASWYAGPLSCGVPIFSAQDAPSIVKLPARSADDLLWYDEHLGMLNVTYAAAWELGRLLAMQNRTIFSLLHRWRRQQIHCDQSNKAAANDGACCHLPQIQCACAQPAPEPPQELKDWLDGLRRLKGVHYRYLLPDERLLPPHSMRFVALDQNYINALLDGVLSSVRAPSPCPDQCREGERKLLTGVNPEIVTGFFLHSTAVAGLSGLEARAVATDTGRDYEAYSSVRLSLAIRLFLFKGRVQRVTLRQRTDAIHLTVRGQSNVRWSNSDKRALAIGATSSSDFAKGMLDRSAEFQVDVRW